LTISVGHALPPGAAAFGEQITFATFANFTVRVNATPRWPTCITTSKPRALFGANFAAPSTGDTGAARRPNGAD
jgi:hypothetical protein